MPVVEYALVGGDERHRRSYVRGSQLCFDICGDLALRGPAADLASDFLERRSRLPGQLAEPVPLRLGKAEPERLKFELGGFPTGERYVGYAAFGSDHSLQNPGPPGVPVGPVVDGILERKTPQLLIAEAVDLRSVGSEDGALGVKQQRRDAGRTSRIDKASGPARHPRERIDAGQRHPFPALAGHEVA